MDIIDDIPVELETGSVIKSLKISKSSPFIEKKIGELVETVNNVAKPKALYTESIIDYTTDVQASIDGHVFNSRVLGKTLADLERCYPYVVTAGLELEEIKLPETQSFMMLDLIKNIVVGNAFEYTKELIAERHNVLYITEMSPGHLEDWQLTEQKTLFNLLGDAEKIGVRLTDSCMMVPIKTVSGILFSSESGFQSCQVCTQSRCMGRKAGYDPRIAKLYGIEPN
jgi:hypothetical protein